MLALERESRALSARAGLSLSFLSGEALARKDAAWWSRVLGVAGFGRTAVSVPDGVPQTFVHAPRLDGKDATYEVWRVEGPLLEGRHGAIRYRCNDRLIFGAVELDEAGALARAGRGVSALQRNAEAAYRQLFGLLDDAGYPGLLRVWNYFPGINAEQNGSERYWQFNAGRQDAFLSSGRATTGNVPAACALGSQAGALSVYFLALRDIPQAIENPRQMCAYHYPAEYGPRSPTFSRASLARYGQAPMLFVSGTASIVGHRTLHAGDVVAQTEESVRNIEAVLAEAARVAPRAAMGLQHLAYKVYVRHDADFGRVRACFEKCVGTGVSVMYLHADVCRADLLVEIEASGGHGMEMVA